MKNIKAIFLDMDGTILHENNKASEYTKQVINELREQNYKVLLSVRMELQVKFMEIICLDIV